MPMECKTTYFFANCNIPSTGIARNVKKFVAAPSLFGSMNILSTRIFPYL